MKKTAVALLIFVLALVIVYLAGPKPKSPEFSTALPAMPSAADELEEYVSSQEAKHTLKPDNEAQIVWHGDRIKTKTAVLYLHGFSASQQEGFPAHRNFARRYGANLYLARIADHGIDTVAAMYHFTADRAWESAKEAYAVARQLGDEVVIMSTSTGGTLAVKLAATYPEIKGLINYSPNIAINDPDAFLLNDPWGLQIARLVFKGDYRTLPSDAAYRKYWYDTYRLESIVGLQELVESVNDEDVFEAVKCPVFSGVYYRDEAHQDPVIKVSAVRAMHEKLATPATEKRLIEFPTAGDHVIASDMRSGAVPEVAAATYAFAEEILGMKPIKKPMKGNPIREAQNIE